MDDPKDKPPADVSRVESITSLDTARMTLRWALERVESLEKRLSEAQQAEKQARLLVELQAQRATEQLRQAEKEKSAILDELNARVRTAKPPSECPSQAQFEELQAAMLREFELRRALEEKQAALEAKYQSQLAALEVRARRQRFPRGDAELLVELERAEDRVKALEKELEARAETAAELERVRGTADRAFAQAAEARRESQEREDQAEAARQDELSALRRRVEEKEDALSERQSRLDWQELELARMRRRAAGETPAADHEALEKVRKKEKELAEREERLKAQTEELAFLYRRRQLEIETLKREAEERILELVRRFDDEP